MIETTKFCRNCWNLLKNVNNNTKYASDCVGSTLFDKNIIRIMFLPVEKKWENIGKTISKNSRNNLLIFPLVSNEKEKTLVSNYNHFCVLECPSGTFDIRRTCSLFNQWCNDSDAVNGCLDCLYCDDNDRSRNKCPECISSK